LEYFKTTEPDDVPIMGLEPALPLTVGRNRLGAAMRPLSV
jgi:hypothetical protein